MSNYLCLKWNNYSATYVTYVNKLQVKEKYCDATIICQGKFFPVHKIILSTCSAYFDELFERIETQHPYIIFKDINPKEMKFLLNYMYQGEVNILQDEVHQFIKAAELLRIKGLGAPDDPSDKETFKKRAECKCSSSQTKRHSEINKGESLKTLKQNNETFVSRERENNSHNVSSKDINLHCNMDSLTVEVDHEKGEIKEEPLHLVSYDDSTQDPDINTKVTNDVERENTIFEENSEKKKSVHIKSEISISSDDMYFEQQSSAWNSSVNSTLEQNLSSSETNNLDEMCEMNEITEYVMYNEMESCSQNTSDSRLNASEERILPNRMKYRCPHCNYSSDMRANVTRHMKFRHTRERPFPCTLCSLRFTVKHHLRDHMRVHTGEKPFQCSDCGKTFSQKGTLSRHLKKKSQCKHYM